MTKVGLEIPAGGIFEFPADEYHRDAFTPAPSLSASLIGPLLITPRHAWTAHPRLNPAWQPADPDKAMDFGTAAHRLLLGKGRELARIDAKDWRTKAAQTARDDARELGLTPILAADASEAMTMVHAALEQLALIDDCFDAFTGDGRAEQIIAWRETDMDGKNPVWCRGMLDWLPAQRETGHVVVYDYKTTAIDVTPDNVGAYLCNRGYDIQAAMYERGLFERNGDVLCVVRFVVQSRKPPYLLIVAELDPAGLMIARKKVAYAINLWRRCLYENKWPGFPTKIVRAETPSFHESRWLAREIQEDDELADGNDPFLVGSRWVPPEPSKMLTTLGD